MADGGYTGREIDKFTLADIGYLFDEWARIPPVRALIAAQIGFKPTEAAPAKAAEPTITDVRTLKAMFPNGGIMRG